MQRVALARALILKPKLLLDEPLAALDMPLREQMRLELRLSQQKLAIPFVRVTRDTAEALTLSDRTPVLGARRGG